MDSNGADHEIAAAGMSGVIALFSSACDAFRRALSRSDDAALDAVDFTGSLHELGFQAGRVRALGEALTLLTGSSVWTSQAEAVLAEYMQATVLPEDQP